MGARYRIRQLRAVVDGRSGRESAAHNLPGGAGPRRPRFLTVRRACPGHPPLTAPIGSLCRRCRSVSCIRRSSGDKSQFRGARNSPGFGSTCFDTRSVGHGNQPGTRPLSKKECLGGHRKDGQRSSHAHAPSPGFHGEVCLSAQPVGCQSRTMGERFELAEIVG